MKQFVRVMITKEYGMVVKEKEQTYVVCFMRHGLPHMEEVQKSDCEFVSGQTEVEL